MKAISDYTIYCTPAQAKKALELGAPIEFEMECPVNLETFERSPYPDVKIGEDGEPILIIPTAEEMIGWLEDFDCIKEITICKTGMWIWGKNHTLIDSGSSYSSRRESSHAAIDAALEYLTNKK